MRIFIITTLAGLFILGLLVIISFPSIFSITKLPSTFTRTLSNEDASNTNHTIAHANSIIKIHASNELDASKLPYVDVSNTDLGNNYVNTISAIQINHTLANANTTTGNHTRNEFNATSKIYIPTNPRGAERLVPGIIVSRSDLYLRKLWGNPSEDLTTKPKYLVAFAVGIAQKNNVDAAVKKFSKNFTIILFHYDGKTSEWDDLGWSKHAIHVSARKQTKWWYAKRFLHPDIVAEYEYIFIWDEDLGVDHFNVEEYIKVVKKYGLEISQPAVESNGEVAWYMTKRRNDTEAHKSTTERPGWCRSPNLPPCTAFVEIMAPVFSRNAWRCDWHMIQNDLVHGWGLDFSFNKCIEDPQLAINQAPATSRLFTGQLRRVPALQKLQVLHQIAPKCASSTLALQRLLSIIGQSSTGHSWTSGDHHLIELPPAKLSSPPAASSEPQRSCSIS